MPGASKTTIRDVNPSLRGLVPQDHGVLRLPGVFEWGPIDTEGATPIVDYDHAREVFGPGYGYLASYESMTQLKQWFVGRGRKAIAVRITHKVAGVTTAVKATYTAQTAATAATRGKVTGVVAAPFTLTNGDTLVGSVDGLADQTCTVAVTQAALECANAENYNLVGDPTLTLQIDGGPVQTITMFAAYFVVPAAATAEEVCVAINAQIVGAFATATTGATKVTITSDVYGTDSIVAITGGAANVALGFAGPANGTGTMGGGGTIGDVTAVTIAECKTAIEAVWTNGGGVVVTDVGGYIEIEAQTIGVAGSIQVQPASTADSKMGLDNLLHSGTAGAAVNTLKIDGLYYGAMGNSITYDVATATNGEASRFDLKVYLYGILKETFRNVTMDTTDARYVEDVVNTLAGHSTLIYVTDQSAVGTPTQRRPADTTGQALAGGDDGLAGLVDADFIGDTSYDDGLYAFETIRDGDILACPDRATTTFQNAAFIWCETDQKGKCFFIPDPPTASDKAAIVAHMGSLTSTYYAAGMPWPKVKVPNPDKTVYGAADTIVIGPSCSWAAKMARNGQEYDDGPFHQPGNEIHGLLTNVVGLEEDDHEVLRESVRDYVTDYKVNPIIMGRKSDGGFGVWVNDVQTMNPTGDLWQSVGEARGVAHLRKVVELYMETRRTQPNTPTNRSADREAIEAYLLRWCVRGAFASYSASEAFYVNTDEKGVGINNPLEVDAGNYHILIGIATARPARFIDIMFTRDQRAIESYIQIQLASR